MRHFLCGRLFVAKRCLQALATLDRDCGRIERGRDIAHLLFSEWTTCFAQAKCKLQVFPGPHDLWGWTTAVGSVYGLHTRQRMIPRGSVRCEVFRAVGC